MDTSYKTVQQEASDEFVEKRSRFIGYCKPVTTEEEALEFINRIKSKHWDARHNVYAYCLREGQIKRYSDDGEPQGTAGMPVLDVLLKSELTDLVVVVTRYFGGILLGTGGLVRAYSDATQKGIENCIKVQKVDGIEIEIVLDYANLEIFKYYCKNNDINITKVEYGENIVLKIEMEKNRKNTFVKDIETKTLIIKEYQVLQEKYINKTVGKNK